jgi:hypothetical protein
LRKHVATILVAALVASASFAGARAFIAVTSSDQPSGLEDIYPQVQEDNLKPRFEGELLGIELGTPDVLAGKGVIVDVKRLCPSGYSVVSSHESIPAEPGYLPTGATQPPIYSSLSDEPNPGANICKASGEPYTAWRLYEFPPLDNGLVPNILITRVYLTKPYQEIDAPADRISVVGIDGRDAIKVSPIVPEGGTSATVTTVIFPEPSGFVAIQAEVLPEAEVMRVAESLFGEAP